MLSFSGALIVFTVTLIPVFLIFLMFSEERQRERVTSSKALKMIIACLILIEISTITLLHIPLFKSDSAYLILPPLIAGLLLCALRLSDLRKAWIFTLFSAILYHIILLYSSPFGISIGEWTPPLAKLVQEGYWDPSWGLLHPTYSPFPMDTALLGTTSLITFIPCINALNGWVINLPFIVAYDLTLYALTKRITNNWLAGVFAIFILASTPLTNIVAHGPEWTASLLVLVSVLMLIRAFDGSSHVSSIIVANISYTAAIFFHATAALGAFLLLGIIVVSYFGEKIMREQVWKNLLENHMFRIAFVTFTVITLARAIYTAGYLESIFPSIKSFVMQILGYYAPEQIFLPVYEKAVSPVNAYAWIIPVSMATALALYSIAKRKALGGALTLIMYMVGTVFLFFGFLSGALVKMEATNLYRTAYPAFIFLIPAAATTGIRALRSSKVLAMILIALMVMSTGIAITDPMLDPQRYKEIGADAPAGTEDYTEARFLVEVIFPTDKTVILAYAIGSCFGYFNVAERRDLPSYWYLIGPLKDVRMEIDRVVLDKEVLPNVVYIWMSDIKPHLSDVPVNILYDSGRYVVFES